MTTLNPRPPYSPEELDQLYPKNLQLQQVQVVRLRSQCCVLHVENCASFSLTYYSDSETWFCSPIQPVLPFKLTLPEQNRRENPGNTQIPERMEFNVLSRHAKEIQADKRCVDRATSMCVSSTRAESHEDYSVMQSLPTSSNY